MPCLPRKTYLIFHDIISFPAALEQRGKPTRCYNDTKQVSSTAGRNSHGTGKEEITQNNQEKSR